MQNEPKNQAGFMSLRKGNAIMQRVAPARFVIVENGMILGSTISGIYSHTIGPRVNPKKVINTNMAAIVMIAGSLSEPSTSTSLPFNIKASVMTAKQIAQTRVPSWMRNFLPFHFITLIVTKAMKAGMKVLRDANRFTASWLLMTWPRVLFP